MDEIDKKIYTIYSLYNQAIEDYFDDKISTEECHNKIKKIVDEYSDDQEKLYALSLEELKTAKANLKKKNTK